MSRDGSALKYRPEIDGLRAVAILAVVAYHAGLGASGGFVGVDVFFVISGFLITSVLLRELEGGRIDLGAFWERRVRRILPALAAIAAVTLVAGWFVLLPADYKELGQSVSVQPIMGANVFFWLRHDYFGTTGDLKPLLHTWSLAVEEQFYLFFPLVVFALSRLKQRFAVATFACLCVVSLALSVYGVAQRPRAAFYLLPFRAWELGLGAILAPLGRRCRSGVWISELLSAGGLIAMVGAMLFFGPSTPFPGVHALVPTVGAGLFIHFNRERLTIVGRLLSWPPFVAIGLISYSLYLWHWPVFVFADYWALDLHPATGRLALAGLCFVLAWLSWKYIEIPFTRRHRFTERAAFFRFAGLSGSALVACGVVVAWCEGAPFRIPDRVLRYAGGRFDIEARFDSEVKLGDAKAGKFLDLGSPRAADPVALLVWGDSHAMAVLPPLDSLGKTRSMRVLAATHSETPPLLGYVPTGKYGLGPDAPAYGEAVLAGLRAGAIPNVLLVARWQGYAAGESPTFHDALARTMTALRQAGTRVWVMREVPNFPWDVPKALARAAWFRQEPESLSLSLVSYAGQRADQDRELLPLVESGIQVLDPLDYLVRDGVMPISEDGNPLYRDTHHLTIHGSMRLLPMFAPIFASADTLAPR